MAQKKKKKKQISNQQSRSIRTQQIIFGAIAVLVIVSFILSMIA